MPEIVASKPEVGVDDLAAIVRHELQQARQAWSNALDHAMKAGDALIAVQPKVAARGINWKKWLRDNCFVAPSTAELYMQLARHRDQIEAELKRNVELSLRAARRLISAKRDAEGNHEEDGAAEDGAAEDGAEGEPETLVAHWRRSPGELAALLDTVGVTGILEAMSVEFGRQLRDRLPAPKRESGKAFKKAITLSANHAQERDRFRH